MCQVASTRDVRRTNTKYEYQRESRRGRISAISRELSQSQSHKQHSINTNSSSTAYIYITPYISIQEVTHFNNEHEFQYLWQIKVNSVFNEGLILSSSGTTKGSAKARRSCIVCREIEGEYCPAREAVSY